MSEVKLTIPNEILQRVLDGFCGVYGYQAVLEDDTPNPETKAAFVKRKIIGIIKGAVIQWESQKAEKIARNEAVKKAENEITIT